jgi:hypothetical protein
MRSRSLALAAFLLFGGCGASERPQGSGAGADAAVDPSFPEPRVRVEFEPGSGAHRFGDVPFPSDLHLDANGDIHITGGLERFMTQGIDIVAGGLAGTRGFARQASGIFFVDGAVDPATLPAVATSEPGASVALVDVDAASPRRGQRTPVRARYLASLGCIVATAPPGAVLPPGTRHALVVTRRVLDTVGTPIGPSPDLERIAALSPANRGSGAEALYGEALDVLVETENLGSAREAAGLAVFTTSRAWEELFELRGRLRSSEFTVPTALWDPAETAPYHVALFGVAGSPNLDDWLGIPPRDETGREWPGGDNPEGVAHDAIGAVASFAMAVPSFLDGTTRHFERGADGRIRAASDRELVPVTLVVPRAPPPAAGYPVVIHGHGLSSDRGSMLSNANELARAGFAIIGIDDVLHGTRAGIADRTNRFPGTFDGPDGIPDALPFAVSFLGGFSDFLANRDNFRQTIVDQVSLVRLVQNPDLDLTPLAAPLGGATPRLDGTRIAWSGGSLGGIVGAMTLSVEREIRAGALQVPGAGFIPFIVSGSAQLAPLVETIAKTNFGLAGDEVLDEFHPLGLLLLQITEAGDPLAYAGAVFGDLPEAAGDTHRPHVLLTYAVDDEVLPNLSTDALIRALGLPIAGPRLVDPEAISTVPAPASGNLDGRTAVAVQYAPAMHALGYNRWDLRQFQPGVPVDDGPERFPRLPRDFRLELPIREHSAQLVHFLVGALEGTPEVIVTAPVRPDYDGDGVDDDAERAAGTDPWDPSST